MAPSLALLAWGVGPTTALVLSQVLLSFGIPFALVPPRAVHLEPPQVMGEHVNGRLTSSSRLEQSRASSSP